MGQFSEIMQRRLTWPKGWRTKEQVAEDLRCSEDRVKDVLRDAIKAGDVIVQTHKVWRDNKVVPIVGYRVPTAKERAEAAKAKRK